ADLPIDSIKSRRTTGHRAGLRRRTASPRADFVLFSHARHVVGPCYGGIPRSTLPRTVPDRAIGPPSTNAMRRQMPTKGKERAAGAPRGSRAAAVQGTT